MVQRQRIPQLLVSVRDSNEAEAALAGGAHLIDVKEPGRGALGRADDAVIADVVRRVAGRRPVSAALGELSSGSLAGVPPGLAYVKWGLAGWGRKLGWQQLLRSLDGLNTPARHHTFQAAWCGPRVVPVAYADWERAEAPSLFEVCAFVRQWGTVVLIDTFDKAAGRTLLDCLPVQEIIRLCGSFRAAGVQVALAGSLGAPQLGLLRRAKPNWFGVRSAACAGGRRDAPVCTAKVRELVTLLATGFRASACGS
jgi:uncharacterized protein (UPF0264 family)